MVMTNIGLEPLPGAQRTNKAEHLQTTGNAPNLPTFLSKFEQREDCLIEETPEWTVVPLTHGFFQSAEPQDQLKVTITKGKALNCKALPCLWTTVEKNAKEHQAALMKEWLSNIGWKTTPGQIRNE
jgi:hypothetical protein